MIFHFDFHYATVSLSCSRYQLELLSTFGTAHSATVSRTNALITAEIRAQSNMFVGYGEIGLPPKKAHCYLADLDSVEGFFTAYCARLSAASKSEYDPFANLPTKYFVSLRGHVDGRSNFDAALRCLFEQLDLMPTPATERAAKYGVEAVSKCVHEVSLLTDTATKALLDIWSQSVNVPLWRLIFGAETDVEQCSKPLYYTVALTDDESELLASSRHGAAHTHFIKVKLNADIERGKRTLDVSGGSLSRCEMTLALACSCRS
jgi:hypothetical protein